MGRPPLIGGNSPVDMSSVMTDMTCFMKTAPWFSQSPFYTFCRDEHDWRNPQIRPARQIRRLARVRTTTSLVCALRSGSVQLIALEEARDRNRSRRLKAIYDIRRPVGAEKSPNLFIVLEVYRALVELHLPRGTQIIAASA